MEPKTSEEIFVEDTEQRQAKVDNFINEAQDGSKLLVQHTIHIELAELLDNPDLKFPTSRAIEVENNEKIKAAVTNLRESIFAMVNGINFNPSISTLGVHTNVEALKPYLMPKIEECAVEAPTEIQENTVEENTPVEGTQAGFTSEGEFVVHTETQQQPVEEVAETSTEPQLEEFAASPDETVNFQNAGPY